MAWLGLGRALFASGMLMMLSNFMFVILAWHGHSNTWPTIAVATEQVTSGIGLTVFVTYLSGLSNLPIPRRSSRCCRRSRRSGGRGWRHPQAMPPTRWAGPASGC
ncbi:hypothetical protein QP185_01625 [Sphingomonas aerolata]|uniref:hypothetical protein n=1 Tax=Sphingomonas aerolata TaxID=185951 RepID=UPI002FE1729B